MTAVMSSAEMRTVDKDERPRVKAVIIWKKNRNTHSDSLIISTSISMCSYQKDRVLWESRMTFPLGPVHVGSSSWDERPQSLSRLLCLILRYSIAGHTLCPINYTGEIFLSHSNLHKWNAHKLVYVYIYKLLLKFRCMYITLTSLCPITLLKGLKQNSAWAVCNMNCIIVGSICIWSF